MTTLYIILIMVAVSGISIFINIRQSKKNTELKNALQQVKDGFDAMIKAKQILVSDIVTIQNGGKALEEKPISDIIALANQYLNK